MKRHINKSISLLLALLLCVGLFALPAAAEELSGTCGDNLNWTLQNGVLTVSGSGAMTDFSISSPAPWMEYAEQIQCVKVSDGVTSIGEQAFYSLSNLTSVTLSASVKVLGELAFAECVKLTQISLPKVEEIGWGCFYNCISLVTVILPDTLRSIGDRAFYFCDSLSAITVPAGVEEFGDMVFSFCESLVYAKILAPITVLPAWTFFGCELLWELYLPDTLQTVESDALGECPDLYYVNCNGSDEAKAEIEYQLAQETIKESSGTSVSFTYSDSAVITTTTKKQNAEDTSGSGYSTTINATVTESSGWDDVVENVGKTLDTGKNPEVTVQMQEDLTVPEGALADLSDREVVVTIHTSDNVDWQVILQDQTADSLAGAQDLNVAISQNNSDKYSDTIGSAESYIVTLGDTTLNATVLVPLGTETARQTATLYVVDGKDLVKLTSVVVDDDGKAAFSLAGTEAGEYVIALDVEDIPQEEVIIPQKLAAEYGIEYTYGATLTDSQGNQYVLTGRVNKLGFGIGTLTLIVVGVLVGSMIVVGIVMVMWNKQQKRKYAQQYRKP